MDGVHTFKRFETGGFPTPYTAGLAGVCVCVLRQVHSLCTSAVQKKNKSVDESEPSNP